MTYEEAHMLFEEKQHEMTVFRGGYSERQIAANGKAIEALEKQIPKKPIKVKHNGLCEFLELCPCCRNVNFNNKQYCGECGQRIDWSEE